VFTLEFAIETINLTKRYGHLTAVDKLNLKVKANTVHGFLGPNGAGKTTTIKILVGLLKPDEGVVKILDQETKGDRPDVRLKIGYMPELPKFPKHLTGYELLDIYGEMYGLSKTARKEQVPKLLEVVGLKERGRDRIGKYSKGMQQRIGIAQALINEPELVILDEPSLGLDPVGMVEVRELIKEVAKTGKTVFISSHLLHEVQQVCSEITIINRGISLTSGTLEEISATFAKLATLEVEVSIYSDAIVTKLKELPFVSQISVDGKKITIQTETRDDIRPQVSRAITASGGVIVSMNLKEQSLEDVFIKLVTESEGARKK
jgi:ABC-2 type transport system ATP-binding protein